MLGIKLDIWLSVAVFDDIYHKIVDYFRVDRSDVLVEKVLLNNGVCADSILAILAKISDDVGNSDHRPLKSGWKHTVSNRLILHALLHKSVKLREILHWLGDVFVQLKLAVVACNTVKCLQTYVVWKDLIQHAYGLDIVQKVFAGVLKVELIEIFFTRVGKWGVTHIVSKGYCLDKIKIEVQRAADSSCNAGNQLNVKVSASYIIVFAKRIYLRFIGITVIIRAVNDFVNIVHEGGAPYACFIFGYVASAYNVCIVKTNSCIFTGLVLIFNSFGKLGG